MTKTVSGKGKSKKTPAELPQAAVSDLDLGLSLHARRRMCARRISAAAVTVAMVYGRHEHAQGASHYRIGRREVLAYAARGVDLAPYEGLNVVCTADDCTVMTVLRNREGRRLRRRA
jgi:hypothetical protein